MKKYLKKYRSMPIAAKAALWFVVCSVLQKSISLITMPIFTRMMSTEQYGQFSVYFSWMQIFTLITTLRLDYAVFNKGMNKYKDDRDVYTTTMQLIVFLNTGILFIIYLLFHKQINAWTDLPTLITIAMFMELFVTPALNFWTMRERYEYRYKTVVARTLIMVILNALLGVLAVYFFDEKGYARILACILVNFFFGVIFFIYNLKKSKRLIVWEYARFAVLFNFPLLLHYYSQYILDQFDRIMIQKLVSVSAAGIYSIAYNAGLIIKLITQSLSNAITPWQYEKLEKKMFKELDNMLFLIFLAVGGCSLIFSMCAPEIMMILADKRYQEAIYVIPPVAIGMFFSFVYTTFANIEFYYDRNKFTMYISIAAALLNIVFNYIGIQLFGYVAAAYTTLFCYIVFAVGHYIYISISIKKLLNKSVAFNSKRLFLLMFIVFICGIIVIGLYGFPILRYLFIIFILVLSYFKRKKITDIIINC